MQKNPLQYVEIIFQSKLITLITLCCLLLGFENREKNCLSLSLKFGSISGAGKFLRTILKVHND